MTDKLPSLDPMLHQPVRTQIMAFLSGRGDTSFTDLKRALEVTDGNLGAHLGKLVEAGLVETTDALAGNRTQTLFRLTAAGRKALGQYVAHLEALMKLVAPQRGKGAATTLPLRPRTR